MTGGVPPLPEIPAKDWIADAAHAAVKGLPPEELKRRYKDSLSRRGYGNYVAACECAGVPPRYKYVRDGMGHRYAPGEKVSGWCYETMRMVEWTDEK